VKKVSVSKNLFLSFASLSIRLQLNITVWHKEKIARNFRQIINLNKIDYCNAKKNINSFPWFKDLLFFAEETMPGLVQDCPYKGVSSLQVAKIF
jgi:hypothetical protein